MEIGEKIKKIRLEKNMKQSDLAKEANISRVAVGNYERGDRQPNIEILTKIAAALNVEVNDLIGDFHVTYEQGERAFDELLNELGCRFEYYQPGIHDNEGNQIDVQDKIEETLFYKGKEYTLSKDLKGKPTIDTLREEVIAFTNFKLQQIIQSHVNKEGE